MSDRMLSFGIQTGQQQVDFAELLRVWQEAERLGFDSGWVFDHFIPIFSNPEGPCLECWVTLATLAARTSRLRVGTLVVGNSYRHPAVLANMGATLDVVSGGRLELGIGAGWWEMEYRAYGIPFPPPKTRIAQLAEAVQVIELLWTQHSASFHGKYYTLADALCEPKPLQKPRPPIWIGGTGEKYTLRVVARYADGWNTFMMPLEQYRHKLDVLAQHCQAVNRDPATVHKSLVVSATVDETRAKAEARAGVGGAHGGLSVEEMRRRMLLGSPEDCAAQLRPYVNAGVDYIILGLRPPYDYQSLRLFAERVIPLLRTA